MTLMRYLLLLLLSLLLLFLFKYGNTPLHYASSEGHKELAEMLINKGADLHKTDEVFVIIIIVIITIIFIFI